MIPIPENFKSGVEIADYAFYYRRYLWTFLYVARLVDLCSEASYAEFCTIVNLHTSFMLDTAMLDK